MAKTESAVRRFDFFAMLVSLYYTVGDFGKFLREKLIFKNHDKCHGKFFKMMTNRNSNFFRFC